MDFFFLLIISVPIFYIWGIISFISVISKRPQKSQQGAGLQSTDRKEYLKIAIAELQKVSEAFPTKKISDLLQEYKAELLTIAGLSAMQPVKTAPVVSSALPKSSDTLQEPVHSAPSFRNWYKDNSINLLLY